MTAIYYDSYIMLCLLDDRNNKSHSLSMTTYYQKVVLYGDGHWNEHGCNLFKEKIKSADNLHCYLFI